MSVKVVIVLGLHCSYILATTRKLQYNYDYDNVMKDLLLKMRDAVISNEFKITLISAASRKVLSV